MRILVMLFTLVCGAVLQAMIPSVALLGEAKVPILLGLVMYYALTQSRRTALQAAIVAGLFHDALGMIPLGYSSACFCMVGVLAGRFKDSVFVHRVVTHTLFGALANGGAALLLCLLLKDQVAGHAPSWVVLKIAASALLGAVFVPVVFRVVETMDGMLGNIELGEA